MTTIKGLPVYDAILDDGDGMVRVSLVDCPAVASDFLAFADSKRQLYAVQDEEQRRVFGVVMRANCPIYREDESGAGYWIVFKPAVLRDMAERYLAEGRANAVDTMHDGNEVEGVEMVQFFIKDSTRGIAPAGFEDIEDGSIFGEYHILNDDVWAAVKAGTYRGFSIETFNTCIPADGIVSEQKIDEDIINYLNQYNMTTKVKNALAQLLAAVGMAEPQKFGSVTTDKGVLSWDGDDDLAIGDEVYSLAEDGTHTAIEDGEYALEDGKTIVVADSKVTDIRDAAVEEPEAPAEEEMEQADPAEEERIKAIETRLDAIEEAIAAIAEELAKRDDVSEAIADLRQQLAAIATKPAAAPATEQFRENNNAKSGDSKADRFAARYCK